MKTGTGTSQFKHSTAASRKSKPTLKQATKLSPINVDAAYTIIYKMGVYFDDCDDWLDLPTADQTWHAFLS
jgi:hypothetical protein